MTPTAEPGGASEESLASTAVSAGSVSMSESSAASSSPAATPTTGMPAPRATATGSPSPSPTALRSTAPSTSIANSGSIGASFDALVARLPVPSARSVGVVLASVGSNDPPVVLGSWSAGPAWSTMKVPLSEAALRQDSGVLPSVRSALTMSDNSAAESLWATLGSGTTAAAKVDAVLAAHGDSATRTQAVRVRPPYTPFGQTTWSLVDQVRFAQGIACSPNSATVVSTMGQVTESQRWGLGSLPSANFKGGWGPDRSGRYLVRQFGIVTIGGKRVAVAVAVEPRDGSFASGTAALSSIARWLGSQDVSGPGHC